MKLEERPLPLNRAAQVLGALSMPMAFAGHLCSLAAVLGAYAAMIGYWGHRRAQRHLLRYTPASARRARQGMRMGLAGLAMAAVMWVLWASGSLTG
jgi:hypothetical protein